MIPSDAKSFCKIGYNQLNKAVVNILRKYVIYKNNSSLKNFKYFRCPNGSGTVFMKSFFKSSYFTDFIHVCFAKTVFLKLVYLTLTMNGSVEIFFTCKYCGNNFVSFFLNLCDVCSIVEQNIFVFVFCMSF
jgi:hypothetical protein